MFENSKSLKETLGQIGEKGRRLWFNIIMAQRIDRLHSAAEKLSQVVQIGQKVTAEAGPKDISWYGYWQTLDFENRGDSRVFTYSGGTQETYERAFEIILDSQGHFISAGRPSWANNLGLPPYDEMKDLRHDCGVLLRRLDDPAYSNQLLSPPVAA